MNAGTRPLPARLGWTAFNALQLIYTVLWTAGCIVLALAVKLLGGGSTRLPLRMAARLWAPGLLHGALAKLQVEGMERVDFSRPHVFVANHQSIIDVCALFSALPVPLRFVLKRQLRGVPFIGWYAAEMGMVFIERDNARGASRDLHAAAQLLRGGASVCAFPEGTRNRADGLRPFKGGAFQAAIQAQVPVVPVAITGSGTVLPPSGFKVRPGTITLRVGAPIPTTGLRPHDRQRLARQAHDEVAAMLR
ncbi:MAG TPA: lysophospholipid acyltransferase family protein [Rhodanobacteraceae bacterium]|nr:lysophospholipid acyltransferase family protein [Rhodanobacteraceae bacterium]